MSVTEICTSHYTENLEWLQRTNLKVTVIQHQGGDPVPSYFSKVYKIPNVGFEASAYLAFIIKRMSSNTLPEWTAFIHGHEHTEHQKTDDLLRDIENHPRVPFHHLNNNWVYKEPDDSDEYVDIEKFEKILGPIPETVWTNISAQFIVHRDRILAHPLEFYKTLFKQVTTKKDATSLEFLWHTIFGEPACMLPPPEAYNLQGVIVPWPHRMVMGIKCTGDLPKFGYPLENIKKVEERDVHDPNMIFVEEVDGGYMFNQHTFTEDELFRLYMNIFKRSVYKSPFKSRYGEYSSPLIDRHYGDFVYIPNGCPDVFQMLTPGLVFFDMRDERNRMAFDFIVEYYTGRVRVVLFDILSVLLITEHDSSES
jgi:hypothetical protein